MGETKTTHTPGPWRARRTALAFAITAGPPGRNGFATVTIVDAQDNPEAEANAALIAAAPEMLEELKEARRALAVAVSANVEIPGFKPEDAICVQRLDRIIAKATEAHP